MLAGCLHHGAVGARDVNKADVAHVVILLEQEEPREHHPHPAAHNNRKDGVIAVLQAHGDADGGPKAANDRHHERQHGLLAVAAEDHEVVVAQEEPRVPAHRDKKDPHHCHGHFRYVLVCDLIEAKEQASGDGQREPPHHTDVQQLNKVEPHANIGLEAVEVGLLGAIHALTGLLFFRHERLQTGAHGLQRANGDEQKYEGKAGGNLVL
mmetsp:Transcript_41254/g.104008  ORF Transcript_41254/g.104008 Transcript_41254/m.104008 type:complete len:209 (+) Transcript_41254:6150-6776(+)